MAKPRNSKLRFEQLEDRICLTASASLVSGSLVVTGDPNGAVEITALENNTYEVLDDESLIATIANVTRDIRIQLNSGSDAITLELDGQTVRGHVFAELVSGTSSSCFSS